MVLAPSGFRMMVVTATILLYFTMSAKAARVEKLDDDQNGTTYEQEVADSGEGEPESDDDWIVVNGMLPHTMLGIEGWGVTNGDQKAVMQKINGGSFKNRFEELELFEDYVPSNEGCYTNEHAFGGEVLKKVSSGEVQGEFQCTPPHFVIDMTDAKAPEERWAEVAGTKIVQNVIKSFVSALEEQGLYTKDLVDKASKVCTMGTQDNYCRELQGFAKYSQVSMGHMVLLNYMYELQSMCTSIIAANENGLVLHARTLDFDYTNFLKHLIITVEFNFGSHRVEATLFAGHIGVLTGVRPGAFALTINQRNKGGMSAEEMANTVKNTSDRFQAEGMKVWKSFKDEKIKAEVMKAFKAYAAAWTQGMYKVSSGAQQKKLAEVLVNQAGKGLGSGALPVALLAREVLATAAGYKDAVQRLKADPILAPVYFIISGSEKFQGTILTRSNDSLVSQFDLSESHPVIAQANSDIVEEPILPKPKFGFSLHVTAGECDLCNLAKSEQKRFENILKRFYKTQNAEATLSCTSKAFHLHQKGTIETYSDYMQLRNGYEMLQNSLIRRLCSYEKGAKWVHDKGICVSKTTEKEVPITLNGTCSRSPLSIEDIHFTITLDGGKPNLVFSKFHKSEELSQNRRIKAITDWYYGFNRKKFSLDKVDPWQLVWGISFPTTKGSFGNSCGTAHATIMTASDTAKYMLKRHSMATIIDWSVKEDGLSKDYEKL